MKLYELTGALADLSSMDIDDEAVKNSLECIQGDFKEKSIAIIKISEGLSADTSVIDAEIKRLQERRVVIENRNKSLRDYLLRNMEASGVTKIECSLFTASLRSGVESVDIYDESQIPDEFMKVEVTATPDKKAIKSAIKGGADIPGVALKRGKNSLVIK